MSANRSLVDQLKICYNPENLKMYHRSLNVPRSARNGGNGRIASLDSSGILCSQQSILTAMERFVCSVNNMHSTILVPSRLRDMQLDGRVPAPHPIKADDLHSFYEILNDVKNELLWGPGSTLLSAQGQSIHFQTNPSPTNSNSTTSTMSLSSCTLGSLSKPSMTSILRAPSVQEHVKRTSGDSLGSTGSDQDTDSDSLSESMMTDRESVEMKRAKMDSDSISDSSTSGDRDGMEHGRHLASAFRHHLQGLHVILHQLADSADYLANRYQQEIEPSTN